MEPAAPRRRRGAAVGKPAGYWSGEVREVGEGDKTLMAALEEVGMTWQEGGRTSLAPLVHGRSLVSGSKHRHLVANRLVGEPSSAL